VAAVVPFTEGDGDVVALVAVTDGATTEGALVAGDAPACGEGSD
jgi:hypothetical protein